MLGSELRQLLGKEMSDKQIAEFQSDLQLFISKYLDDYFADEFTDDEE